MAYRKQLLTDYRFPYRREIVTVGFSEKTGIPPNWGSVTFCSDGSFVPNDGDRSLVFGINKKTINGQTDYDILFVKQYYYYNLRWKQLSTLMSFQDQPGYQDQVKLHNFQVYKTNNFTCDNYYVNNYSFMGQILNVQLGKKLVFVKANDNTIKIREEVTYNSDILKITQSQGVVNINTSNSKDDKKLFKGKYYYPDKLNQSWNDEMQEMALKYNGMIHPRILRLGVKNQDKPFYGIVSFMYNDDIQEFQVQIIDTKISDPSAPD